MNYADARAVRPYKTVFCNIPFTIVVESLYCKYLRFSFRIFYTVKEISLFTAEYKFPI